MALCSPWLLTNILGCVYSVCGGIKLIHPTRISATSDYLYIGKSGVG